MKIVSRKQFMELPVGTVYSNYEPCCFDDLNIKASDLSQGWAPDFLYDPIIGALDSSGSDDFFEKCELMEKGESVPMDFEYTGREGLFNDNKLYAVLEEDDLKKLIARLTKAYESLISSK